MPRRHPSPTPTAAAAHPTQRGAPGRARYGGLRREFVSQGAFLYLPEFLAPQVTAQLIAAVAAVEPAINRNYLPGHKQGGSVSRHTIDQLAPFIGEVVSLAGAHRHPGEVGGRASAGVASR